MKPSSDLPILFGQAAIFVPIGMLEFNFVH